MNYKKANPVKRFFAFVIDYNLIFIIGDALFLISPSFSVEYLLRPSIKMFSVIGVALGIIWFLLAFLCKDILFGNASLGKKIFRLQVLDRTTGQKPTVRQLVLRNVFLLFMFLQVEMIVIIANRQIRLGDMIADTVVCKK